MATMTETVWRLLEAVGRRRERGITQVELHQALNIGAQSIFHIVKQLTTRDLM
jgi:DNA-binding IclR family transcriptional regulator